MEGGSTTYETVLFFLVSSIGLMISILSIFFIGFGLDILLNLGFMSNLWLIVSFSELLVVSKL